MEIFHEFTNLSSNAFDSTERAVKRRKIDNHNDNPPTPVLYNSNALKVASHEGHNTDASAPSRRMIGMGQSRLPNHRADFRFCQPPSLHPLLSSFISSSRTDLYRIHSVNDLTGAGATYALPFTSVFSRGAKRGENHLAAIAGQEGCIDIMNLKPRSLYDPEPQRTTISAHNNAIFDVQWSLDDTKLVTSSGDDMSGIFDVETQTRVGVLAGHNRTVKTTVWDPVDPSLLVSASRDGNIHLWDLRLGRRPVKSICDAHGEHAGTRKTKQKLKSPSIRSVTSLNHIPHRPHLLLTSGSADGVLKTWDIRKLRASKSEARTIEPYLYDISEDPTVLDPENGNVLNTRPRGITSVVVDKTGSWAWALTRGGSIYTYRIDDSVLRSDSDAFPITPLCSPFLKVDSFYSRLALSPDGLYLAAGSSIGDIVLWDAEALLRIDVSPKDREGVRLMGHTLEVGGLDWGRDMLMSASDDTSVRVWRMDAERAQKCRLGEESWDYGFARLD